MRKNEKTLAEIITDKKQKIQNKKNEKCLKQEGSSCKCRRCQHERYDNFSINKIEYRLCI